MSSNGLGQFEQGIQAWRRLMASMPAADVEGRWTIFYKAAKQIGGYVEQGLDRIVAADELQDIATGAGLAALDQDGVQQIIAEALREKFNDHVPPLWEEETPKANGKGPHEQPASDRAYFTLPDEATMASREWLSFQHYMRGNATATVAPGGYGKTSLAIYEMLEMVKMGLRVWYISAEDDQIEVARRIHAYRHRHGLTQEQLNERLIVDDRLSYPFKIARMGKGGAVFDEAKLAEFEQIIERQKIDVVFLDPFVSFHLLSENDTSAMDALVKRLGQICARHRMCIELPHHVRKRQNGATEVTVEDARGAAAIVNAVRSCRVINVMTEEEAGQAKVKLEERRSYLRLDNGKSNMAPAEKARWLHLTSVQLLNGDNVAVIEPWTFPKVFDDVSTADVAWVQGLVAARMYRADSRSPDWLGLELAVRFDRPIATVGNIPWINKVLTTWVHNRVIGKARRRGDDRHEHLYFVPVGSAAAAQNPAEEENDDEN